MRILVFGVSLILLGSAAAAQTSADPRWSPWLGCWELVADQVRDPLSSAEQAVEAPRTGSTVNGRGARICVTPATEGGVTMTTFVGDQSVLEQTVVANALDRPISDASCRGTQRAEWSKDGSRLFSRAELTCPNEARRTVSGFGFFATNGHWVDVQAITVASRDSVRVRRYRRAADQAQPPLRAAPTARLTIDDVKEASSKISPLAIEAALIETNASFRLNSKTLIDLDKSGVPDAVVDLMVALSYPEAFTVERVTSDDRVTPDAFYPLAGGWALGYPLWPYGSHAGFGDYYWSPYYYSPFGYSYMGIYPYYGSSIVIVDSAQASPSTPVGTNTGRVVDGLGYTRVTPRTTGDVASSGDAGSGTRSGGGRSGGGTVSAEGWSSGGSSSGGSSSSGGGGGGGDGGGRTAVPR